MSSDLTLKNMMPKCSKPFCKKFRVHSTKVNIKGAPSLVICKAFSLPFTAPIISEYPVSYITSFPVKRIRNYLLDKCSLFIFLHNFDYL